MALTKVAILALRGLSRKKRQGLADRFGVSIGTMNRWIASNDDELTKAKFLDGISEEIGLPVTEILEKDQVSEESTK